MNNTSPSKAILIFTIASGFSISSVGAFGGVITAITIAKNKKLHSPCYTLIAGGGVASFIVAISFFTRAIDQLGLYLGVFPVERSGFVCFLATCSLGISSMVLHSLVTLCIAADRLIGILMPNRYRLWGKRYAHGALAACVIFVTVHESIGFITARLHSRVICTDFAVLHPIYAASFVAMNFCVCALTVVAYGAMWAVFRYKYKQYEGRNATESERFMRQQLAVVPTVKMIGLLYLATGVMAEIYVNIGVALAPGEAAFVLFSLANFFKSASSLVDVVALLLKNQTFRQSCRSRLGWKENTVSHAAAGNAIRRV